MSSQENRNEPLQQHEITAGGKTFRLIQADPQHTEEVRELLTEAAVWMQNHGINQWKPQQFTPDEVRSNFENRLVFMAYDGKTPAGMFTLQHSDRLYWKTEDDPAYYYLHKLTVSVPYRRYGLGKAFLEWAMEKAAQEGKKGLRLDCRSISEGLNRYYQSQGFVFQGTSEQKDHMANLYERLT